MLEPDLLEKLLGPCQKTLIYELEFLAVTLSWMIWKERLQWATVMCFIDNNGVKDSTIRGRTDNALAEFLLEIILTLETSSHAIPWYARVPSPSIPSDSLSRGSCDSFPKSLEVCESVIDQHLADVLEQWFSMAS